MPSPRKRDPGLNRSNSEKKKKSGAFFSQNFEIMVHFDFHFLFHAKPFLSSGKRHSSHFLRKINLHLEYTLKCATNPSSLLLSNPSNHIPNSPPRKKNDGAYMLQGRSAVKECFWHILPSGCSRMELKLNLGLVMFPRKKKVLPNCSSSTTNSSSSRK